MTPPQPLPDSVRAFISAHIESVEQLEILMLVSADPNARWTAEAVFRNIQSNPKSIAERMKYFASSGLFEVEQAEPATYRFKPASTSLEQVVKDLRRAYGHSRVRVIEAIFSGPGPAAQHFADSFRLRKDKP